MLPYNEERLQLLEFLKVLLKLFNKGKILLLILTTFLFVIFLFFSFMWGSLLFGHINEINDDIADYNILQPMVFDVDNSNIGKISTNFSFEKIDFDNFSINDKIVYKNGSNLLFEIVSESPCDTVGTRKLILEIVNNNHNYHVLSAYFIHIRKQSNVEFRYTLDNTYQNKVVIESGKLTEIDLKTKLSGYQMHKGSEYIIYPSTVYFKLKKVPFISRISRGKIYYGTKFQILNRYCPKGV